jgi:hypothetical protein
MSSLGFLMSHSVRSKAKNKFRITIEIDAYDDFNPFQINWKKLFELNENERVKAYVEDLNS